MLIGGVYKLAALLLIFPKSLETLFIKSLPKIDTNGLENITHVQHYQRMEETTYLT